jgi:hypothetical protein
MLVKMPLKSVREGQVIDLQSIIAFFDKAKWTELAITHEINRVLGRTEEVNQSLFQPKNKNLHCIIQSIGP